MAYVKVISGHTSCGGVRRYLEEGRAIPGVDRYLDRDGRSLALDLLNIGCVWDRVDWATAMDRTREAAGNDRAWGDRAAVTYRHIIVSPDPEDDISLEDLRSLVLDYLGAKFGRDWVRGEHGLFQVAVCYHDDNAGGILHAHAIVNNTDLETGSRLHFTNREVRAITDDLQKMCRERGLRYLDYVGDGKDPARPAKSVSRRAGERRGGEGMRREDAARDVVRKQSSSYRYQTRAERAARAAGGRMWKDDLRDWVVIAANTSVDKQGFERRLGELGIAFVEKNGDYLYMHPDAPESRKCYGRRLGRAFTPAGVCDVQRASRFRAATRLDPDGPIRLASVRTFAAGDAKGLTLRQIADAVAAVNSSRATCQEDLERELAKAEALASRLPAGSRERERAERRREVFANACAAAPRLGLFDWTLPAAEREANRRERALRQAGDRLASKIARGQRLTREEYKSLTDDQRRELFEAQRRRRLLRTGMSGYGGGGSASSSGSGGRTEERRARGRGV